MSLYPYYHIVYYGAGTVSMQWMLFITEPEDDCYFYSSISSGHQWAMLEISFHSLYP